MPAFIITVLLGFIWLGYETNWLTIQLPYGEALEPPIKRISWGNGLNAMDWRDWRTTTGPTDGNGFKDWITPLCGWDYILNNQHIVPTCKVELDCYGIRYKMTILSPKIMNKVMSANKITKAKRLAYLAIN